MELTLTRTSRQAECTTGVLYLGKERIAHTLEPRWRDLGKEQKVAGQTAILEGTYEICLEVSARFKRLMPYLMNVPGFTGILIHCGNTVADTEGCILVGKRSVNDRLSMSRSAFNKLFARLKEAWDRGEPIILKVE